MFSHDLLSSKKRIVRRRRGSKKFSKFTIFLNEDKNNLLELQEECPANASSESTKEKSSEDKIAKLGKLLQVKIQSHCGETVELFTGDEVIANNSPSLVSVMFRLACEDFVRKSSAIFKIIECRNSTKLATEWKPNLVDVVLSLGHQIIMVELTEFPHYTDFTYSILRQINYDWKIRLPRSFFYPDDVCEVDYTHDQQVVVVTPLMPDGDIDLASRIEDNLKYEILRMIKDSCANGLKNHLLKRDFRVGKLSDTEIGVNSIRRIYRTLQRRLQKQGSDIQFGKNSEDFHQLILSVAGDSLMTAESCIEYCKNPRPDSPINKDSCINTSQILPGATTVSTTEPETVTEEEYANKGDSSNPKSELTLEDDPSEEPDIFDEILKAIKNLDLKHSDVIEDTSPLPYMREKDDGTGPSSQSDTGSGDASPSISRKKPLFY